MVSVSANSNKWRCCTVALLIAAVAAIVPVASAQAPSSNAKVSPAPKAAGSAPTVAEAERFISEAETRLLDLWIKSIRASWVSETFITDDTESIAADAQA